MVGPEDVGVEGGTFHVGHGSRRGEYVVDPPADIALAHAEALAPPTVVPGALLEMAEGVHPPRAQPPAELLALLQEETTRLPVVPGPGEIDFLMRRVEVPHDHEPLAVAQALLQQLVEAAGEGQLEGHPAVVALLPIAIWEVAVDHGALAE